MLSSIEPHLLFDDSRPSVDSGPSGSPRISQRAHPRLTVYRILFFVLTAGLGGIKAVSSYQGYVTVPTTFDWVYGIVVVSGLDWLGLYQDECPGRLPPWLFEVDIVEASIKILKQIAKQVQESCQNLNIHAQKVLARSRKEIVKKLRDRRVILNHHALGLRHELSRRLKAIVNKFRERYHKLNIQTSVRKVFGYSAQKCGDPEQHIEMPPMQREDASASSTTGVQLSVSDSQLRLRTSAQQPTCTDLCIRSVEDAHKVFFAVQNGTLHMVTRRLNTSERQALQAGCVYVWEERRPKVKIAKTTDMSELPIERWTDSRRWGPSRREEGFRWYEEKHSNSLDSCRVSEKEPLCKQTYSAFVKTEGGQKTLHLIAYFTRSTAEQLGTVDGLPDVRHLEVPLGMFMNARQDMASSGLPASSIKRKRLRDGCMHMHSMGRPTGFLPTLPPISSKAIELDRYSALQPHPPFQPLTKRCIIA
ncbi:hypothetical protein C8R45DRAFT_1180458 [Mycena sanguinolenta]|nr:hypothetical protein C8R45DRAFT_1180458 [Mycena sanguinolenta]